MFLVLFWMPAAITTALAVDAGTRWPGSKRWFAGLAAGLAIAVGVSILGNRGYQVTTGRLIAGAAVGGILGVALPLFAFYRIGVALRTRRRAAFIAWGIAQAPLIFFLFVVLVWSADLAQCGPDAYECPI